MVYVQRECRAYVLSSLIRSVTVMLTTKNNVPIVLLFGRDPYYMMLFFSHRLEDRYNSIIHTLISPEGKQSVLASEQSHARRAPMTLPSTPREEQFIEEIVRKHKARDTL